jgi:hypothetical protein
MTLNKSPAAEDSNGLGNSVPGEYAWIEGDKVKFVIEEGRGRVELFDRFEVPDPVALAL